MMFPGFDRENSWIDGVAAVNSPHGETDTPFPLNINGPRCWDELLEVRPGPALDPANGVWGLPESSVAEIARGLQRPEFQVVRIPALVSVDLGELERETRELVARQITIRETRFDRRLDGGNVLSLRDLAALGRGMGFEQSARHALREAVERSVELFRGITGERHIRVQLETQRGPRRLELEGADGGGVFHVDAAGVRLVATLVGPGTLFPLDRAGSALGAVAPRSRREPEPLTPGEPFDLGRAVEANYRRLMAPGVVPPGEPLFAVSPGGGIIFQGSAGTACRPLIHAAPQPGDLGAALTWCRLLLFIDAA